MHRSSVLIILAACVSMGILSCRPSDETEQELITKVTLSLTDANGNIQTVSWNDNNGDGVADGVDSIHLTASQNYACTVHVFDGSVNPAADITPEIQQESAAHLFVFNPGSSLNLVVVGQDADTNGKPFNLQTMWTAGAASSGVLNIQLKHEPDKNAAQPALTGETDFDLNFPVEIRI